MRAFTEALRKEVIDTRIRVITVDPGQVLTVSGVFGTGYERDADSCDRSSL